MIISSINDFVNSLNQEKILPGMSPELQSLWHGLRGDWDTAHVLVQALSSEEGAWIHAWLHRIEGDLNNADYWYRHAGRPRATGDLQEEGKAIANALLNTTSFSLRTETTLGQETICSQG